MHGFTYLFVYLFLLQVCQRHSNTKYKTRRQGGPEKSYGKKTMTRRQLNSKKEVEDELEAEVK